MATLGETEATFKYRKGQKVLIDYTKTAIDEVVGSQIVINGSSVTVSGANGKPIMLFNTMGQMVAQSTSGSLSAPASGIYVLSVDGHSRLVRIM